MRCLECDGDTKVVDSRGMDNATVIRRRKCKSCGCLFYTLEEAVDYEDIATDLRHKWKEFNEKKLKES